MSEDPTGHRHMHNQSELAGQLEEMVAAGLPGAFVLVDDPEGIDDISHRWRR